MPSEYMIEMMAETDLLLPIDYVKIPNVENIDPYFLDLPFDPGNKYSFHTSGERSVLRSIRLCWMVKRLKVGMIFGILLKQQVILVDSARETVGMALNSLGTL